MTRIIYWLFFIFSLFSLLGITGLLISHDNIASLSTDIYGYASDGPLMGSHVADILLHPLVGLALACYLVFLIAKEFIYKKTRTKVYLNLLGILFSVFFGGLYTWVSYNGYLFSPA